MTLNVPRVQCCCVFALVPVRAQHGPYPVANPCAVCEPTLHSRCGTKRMHSHMAAVELFAIDIGAGRVPWVWPAAYQIDWEPEMALICLTCYKNKMESNSWKCCPSPYAKPTGVEEWNSQMSTLDFTSAHQAETQHLLWSTAVLAMVIFICCCCWKVNLFLLRYHQVGVLSTSQSWLKLGFHVI